MGQGADDDRELVALTADAADPRFREQAEAQLTAARVTLLELITAGGVSVDELIARAKQSHTCWELEALIWQLYAKPKEAAEASKQAVAQGLLAIKLEASRLSDRVTRLEQHVAMKTRNSGSIRAASKARKK